MPRLPLIGVSAGRVPAGNRTIDGADRDYTRAVRMAGGTPVLLPPGLGTGVDLLVERIDGLLLSGGGDVDPALYSAPPDAATGGVDRERDETERALLVAALAKGVPVLGICRGCQIVNVALGGTLHQHLPEVTGLEHLQPEPRDRPAHRVSVEKGSLLHEVLGVETLEVNSIHHQAVDRLAGALRVVASSPDGVVEGIEDPHRRLLAVQWHPEALLPAEPHLALFCWLTRSAA